MPECPYTPSPSEPHPGTSAERARAIDEDLARLIARDPAVVRCPWPLYEVLRAQAPVVHNAALNAFVVTRYADVIEVLKDTTTYSSAMASGPNSVTGLAEALLRDPASSPKLRAQAQRRLELAESPVLLFTDPPLHKRQRALVSAAFSPKRISALEPEVRRLVDELIDAFIDAGTVDLVPAFAIPLPMTVIATMLGVPAADLARFKRWSNAFTAGVGAIEQSQAEIAEIFAEVDTFYDYFTEQIERRRTAPREDLLTDLVTARMDGEAPLRLDEILQMLVQFLVAGNETTTNSLATLMLRLAQDPELAGRVRAEPALIPALVEEMLRIEAPVQGMFRVATLDSRIADVEIPAGSVLWLVYGAANLDPEIFPDPTAIDLDGERAAHLSFARFEHFCLGSAIARLELRIATELLLERLADLRLTCDPAEIPQQHSFVLRGPASLPLRFSPRRPASVRPG